MHNYVPVLNPQITGEPTFPDDVTEKESVVQSPMEPPFVDKVSVAPINVAVPTVGDAMLNVYIYDDQLAT